MSKYPENRKRPKDYIKDTRMIKIKQLPENEHLLKSQDREYCRRYSKEYHRLQQNEWKRIWKIKGSMEESTGVLPDRPLKIKKGQIVILFD